MATASATAISFKFLSAGSEFGKILTPVMQCRLCTGQFEFAGNIMPLWQAYTPAPHMQTFTYQGDDAILRCRWAAEPFTA